VSNAAWISMHVSGGGSGDGTVKLDIQSNTDGARSGTATIAGHVVTVNQDGCRISIMPSSRSATAAGGPGSVAVSAGASCAWTAVSGVGWITVTSGASGSGDGTVQYTVDANTTGVTRTGTITIGDKQFTISQAGS
jgi:hypothetical protein